MTDFYRPLLAKRAGRPVRPDPQTSRTAEAAELKVARICTFGFGLLLAAVALAFAGYDTLLWEAFKWVGLILGGMLGVFLLGVTTKTRGHDRINVAAMLSSVALLVAIKLYQEITETVLIAWPWWVVLGTVWTYGVGVCFSGRGRRAK